MTTATVRTPKEPAQVFMPREHGATAMLLTPFIAAAILLRHVYWPEFVALLAIVCAFVMKDPLVVIARQRFVWRQEHAETNAAKRTVAAQTLFLIACGAALLSVRDGRPFVFLFLGAAAFTALAVMLTVRNRQRSEWFQVASAVALSSTCLVASLSATGAIPKWCWLLWFLCALQATAGIFVVHARLDARIAARKGQITEPQNRRAAFVCAFVLLLAGAAFISLGRAWIAIALCMAAIAYLADLARQKSPEALQMPLKRVGLQALALSTAYALLIIAGLWRG
jgi:hypothetical protein